MAAYTCTVSVQAGKAPEDAKAHHVKDNNRVKGNLPAPNTSNAKIPTVTPTFVDSRSSSNHLRATKVGHASYLVEFPSGFRTLFDMVLEERYRMLGPKRFTPAAYKASDIPELNAVFISHNHHDHLFAPSVKELSNGFPSLHNLVGHGLAKWFRDTGITAVTEIDWWENAEVALQKVPGSKAGTDAGVDTPEEIKALVSCLPSQHRSLRSGFDYGHTLGASWAIISGGKSVWFAGDTGYRCVPKGIEELGPDFDKLPRNLQFTQTGNLRGPFDLGLIPIGAYHPRFMYSGVHASPYDAVEIFQDTKCKRALEMKGLAQTGLFDVCAVGESREF